VGTHIKELSRPLIAAYSEPLDSYSIDLLLQLQGAGGEVDPAVLQSMVEDMREREEELNRKYRYISKIVDTK
jgi:hypothetical protein